LPLEYLYQPQQSHKDLEDIHLGYTHYFPQQRAFTDSEWQAITKFANSLFEHKKDLVADGRGDLDTEPLVNDEYISFNGIEDLSYETFSISKLHDTEYNFCKTNQKPYDVVVTALLTHIKKVAPDALSISSDGDEADWAEGVELENTVSEGILQ
jgi:hypothetical protein